MSRPELDPDPDDGYCPACNGSGEGMRDGSACGLCRGKRAQSRVRGGKTGWPAGLLQDDDRGLSKWFAGRLGAREAVRT